MLWLEPKRRLIDAGQGWFRVLVLWSLRKGLGGFCFWAVFVFVFFFFLVAVADAKMFFEVEMRRMVVVEPRELGDALHTKRALIRRLLTDVDAERCTEEHGYLVAVTTLEDILEGKVRTGTGAVVFWVSFKCIVFKPIRNEVVDAEVTDVMHGGFLAACGPLQIFVQRRYMNGFEFREGPSVEYNKWTDGVIPVTHKSLVRLKIVGVKWNAKDRTIMTIGSLNGNHLGPVQKIPAL